MLSASMTEIHARLILEILGRPKDYVTESLSILIDKLKEEKDIKILDKIVHEPVEVKEAKDLYTTFAEVEAKFNSFEYFISILFRYMPSNVEVFSPETFKLNSADVNSLSNMLITRLHQYDAIVKQAIGEKDILVNQLKILKSNQVNHNIVVKESIDKEVKTDKLEKKEVKKTDKTIKKSKKAEKNK